MTTAARYRHVLRTYQPTSRQAWQGVADQLAAVDAQILRYILAHDGATCSEVEDALGLSHQTASAQIRHMVEGDVLADSGETRRNAKNRQCIVWAVPAPPPPPQPAPEPLVAGRLF